jgi:molecular chaperone DnaK
MAIIGIDLGTSNSAAAVLRGGRPVMIPSAEGVSLGGKAFTSYVAPGGRGRSASTARRALPRTSSSAWAKRLDHRAQQAADPREDPLVPQVQGC